MMAVEPIGGGTADPVLAVSGYSLAYMTPTGPVEALQDIDLGIANGQTMGLVGESGSGKTSLAWAIMRYLPDNAIERKGEIALRGENLRNRSPGEILEIRGRRISMVFQDPGTALNPVLRLGDQISEVLVRHRGLSPREARAEGEAMLARTGITRPADMMKRYPHEASGGEKQRVVIATAFACNPEVILFDEPTTALDVLTAHQILDLFDRLRAETHVTALYISHDLGLVARIADEVAVIHGGRIVEQGPRGSDIRGAEARLHANPACRRAESDAPDHAASAGGSHTRRFRGRGRECALRRPHGVAALPRRQARSRAGSPRGLGQDSAWRGVRHCGRVRIRQIDSREGDRGPAGL